MECDDEWILRKTQGSYFLRIGDFMKKTRWPSEIFLDSKVFVIGNAKFKLRFFPNNSHTCGMRQICHGSDGDGSPHQEGFVGVYLYNEANFDVLADITIKLGSRSMTLQKQFLRGKECTGWPRFLYHDDLQKFRILNKDGKLEVSTQITTNWERKVNQNQSWTDKDLLQGILLELQNLRAEVKDVRAQLEDKRVKEKQTLEDARSPVCGKCSGSLKPPTMIYQCTLGHLVCKDCFDNLQDNQCQHCPERVIGRATGLETYLLSCMR